MADSSLNSMFSDWMPSGYFDAVNPDSMQYFNPSTENADSRYDEILAARPEMRGALDFLRSGKAPTSGWMERTIQGAPGSMQQVEYGDNGNPIANTFATHMNDDSPFWLGANLAGSFGAGLTNPGSFGKALYGGFSGAANTMGTQGNALTGGVLGTLGAYKPDIAGFGGVSGSFGEAINGGLYGGLSSGLNKGSIGQGAVMGAAPGLASMAGNSLSGSTMDTPFGRNYSTTPGLQQSNVGEITGNAPQQSYAPWAGNEFSAPAVNQEKQGLFESSGLNDFFSGLGNYLPSDGKGWGDMAQGLAGIYQGYRQRRNADSVLSAISGRRGGYEKNLRASLMARDAASGRRSNYEGREAQLQGDLAKLDMGNAPLIANLSNASTSGLVGMLASGLRWGGKSGLFGDSYNPNVPTPQFNSAPAFSLSGMGSNPFASSLTGVSNPLTGAGDNYSSPLEALFRKMRGG